MPSDAINFKVDSLLEYPRRLKEQAAAEGLSAGDIVRRAVDAYLIPREGLRAALGELGEVSQTDWLAQVRAELGPNAPRTPWEWVAEARRRLGPVEAARVRAKAAPDPTEAELEHDRLARWTPLV